MFFAVCIFALVLAQGNQIDKNGNIVSTSILRINSVPEDVTVYINDQLAVKKENRVEWLQPGTVKVTLKKAGYITWEKTLELNAGIIEDIYAQLYPERPNFEKITSANIDNFYFSNNTDYIFYTIINGENESDNGLWKLKLKRNILDIGELLPSKVYTFTEEELIKLRQNDYSIKITDDVSKVLVDIPILKELYYIDLNNPIPLVITDILTFYPQQSEWLRNSNTLIASNGNLLIALDINSRNQDLIYYSPDKEILYSVASNEVYYYRYDKNKLYNLSGSQSIPVVLPNTYKGTGIVTKLYSPKDNNEIFFIQENENLHFVDLEKDITLPFPEVKEVLAVARNGKNITYIDTENNFKSIVLKDSLDFKSYTYTIHSVDLNKDELNHLFYSPSGKNLIALVTKEDEKKNIWFMDNDGLNSVNLINNEKLVKNKVDIDGTGLSLYVLLEDNSELDSEATVNNIYRYTLEVK